MSIETVCAGLVAIGADVAGIESAPDPPPENLDSASLPALYALTGESMDDDTMLGAEFVQEIRTYRVQVAVAAYGEGTVAQTEGKARPLIQLVKSAYANRPNLESILNVQKVRVLGDSGVEILAEYGGKFIGFEVRVEVTEYASRTIVEG